MSMTLVGSFFFKSRLDFDDTSCIISRKEKTMNPQPHPFVGQLGVLIIALLTVYFSFTNKRKGISFSDEYVIGYINDNVQHSVEFVDNTKTRKTNVNKSRAIPLEITSPVQKPVVQKPVVQQKKVVINQELFNDCMLALVSLGTKKTEAKRITQDIFIKHNPSTIEDFIKFVYVK
jgi:AAA15 family ATPase/GTPase